jgi:hypothetical protein
MARYALGILDDPLPGDIELKSNGYEKSQNNLCHRE